MTEATSEATTTAWPLSGFGDEVDPDPAVQAAVLLALGASYIEVRSAWGVNVSELTPKQVSELKEILDAKGLKVSAVASPIGKVDISLPVEHEVERLRQIISVAKGLDTKYIRVFSFFRSETQTPEEIRDDVITRMRALAAEAVSAGVVLLHENEKDALRRYAAARPGHHGVRGLSRIARRLGQRQLRPGWRPALHRWLRHAPPLPRIPPGQGRHHGHG
ncbi:UNVERIFIED_ORG: sugar phosphate isomerase/epimerase [Arthrobacter sp. UYCu721]